MENQKIGNGSFAVIMLVGLLLGVTSTAFYFDRYKVLPLKDELARIKTSAPVYTQDTLQKINLFPGGEVCSQFKRPLLDSRETLYHKILEARTEPGAFIVLDTGNLVVYSVILDPRKGDLMSELRTGDVLAITNDARGGYETLSVHGKPAAELLAKIERGEVKNPVGGGRTVTQYVK